MPVSPTTAPDVTISITIPVTPTPAATPTLSPAGPPPIGPYFPPQPTPAPGPVPEVPPKKFLVHPLVIYGYGPSSANVRLTGWGVDEETKSDRNGYFAFEAVHAYSEDYPELCIQATDSDNRITYPVCIPPRTKDSVLSSNIGPVLLSPTISIDTNNVLIDQYAKVEGFTIPNSTMNIYVSRKEGNSNLFSFVSPAYAYNVPVFQTKSDSTGAYSFTLPTQDATSYRVYTSSFYGDNISAKSNTLNFSVLTKVESGIAELKSAFLEGNIGWIVLLEILIVVFLVIAILKAPTRRQRKGKNIASKKKKEKPFQEVGLKNKYLEYLRSKGLIS